MGKMRRLDRPKQRGLVIGVSVLCITALFAVIIQVLAVSPILTSSTRTPLLPPPTFEMLDAGMCPPRTCHGNKQIRQAWTAFAPSTLADEAEHNDLNAFQLVTREQGKDFSIMTRDRTLDQFISGTIRKGQRHDPSVGDSIAYQMLQQPLPEGQTQAVFIDVGANIGYFTSTALALGAFCISFEPMRPNLGALMSTTRKNKWEKNSRIYHNAVSYEGATVNMVPTNLKVNLSNGRVRKSVCEGDEKGQYGVDWMESVSLDQVMMTKHPEIKHVQAIKIDVETFEVHVINGAMRFLCNSIVDMIIMEVEYIRPNPKTVCDSVKMQETLEKMGFSIWSELKTNGGTEFTGKPFNQLPANVNFVQEFRERTPAERLKGAEGNPCEGFEI
jgi:FkbM family methyltransferase